MAATTATKPFRIGMLGAGTVGGGVYELIMGAAAASSSSSGGSRPVVISKICVRSLDKPRDFTLDPAQTVLTTDVSQLLQDDDDDDIDCLVEVAGGCGDVVKGAVLKALQQGKVVVTANKALLAEHLPEIEQTAAASSNNPTTARLGYEAAVCGGIPIINALATAYAGDQITAVAGICNGTTNFMLSAMAKDSSIQYADILKQAQDLGYAEADPTADVEGHDVRAKIAILAKLAFGKTVAVEDIPCAGISQITSDDFSFAKEKLGATIKLIGTAALVASKDDDDSDEEKLSVYVTPAVVPWTHMLATIDGSGNCVSVTSRNMGTCSYTGPGAGRYPTANSIVADIYRAAEDSLPCTAFPVPRSCAGRSFTLEKDYKSDFYIRIPVAAATIDNVDDKLLALGRQHGLDLTVDLTEFAGPRFAIVRDATQSAVAAFGNAVAQLDCVSGAPLCMPIMKE